MPPSPALRRALRPDLAIRQAALSQDAGEALVPGWGEWRLAHGVADLWARWSPAYDAREDLVHLADALPDRAHWTAALRYYRDPATLWSATAGPYSAEHRASLRSVRGDLLFLYGDQDGCVLPQLLARAAADLPASQFVPGTGHFLHLEEPEVVSDAVRSFLAA